MLVLLDTNIVIEHLRFGMLSNVSSGIQFAVSVITEAELFRFAGMADDEEECIRLFLRFTNVIPIDSEIAQVAARLGRTRPTKLPDLLIAATALVHRIPLVTKNTRDFSRIQDLEMLRSI